MNTAAPARHVEPPAFLADPALRAVLTALPQARLVGGCVRDALLGRDVADIDLGTPEEPQAVVAALAHAGLKSVPTGLAHGTVTAISGHRGFEVTTLRRDMETDGRHAVVAFTADWQADAARRDFTINALSMTPQGDVFDYFGGLDDLEAGRVRFVGDAGKRISEDYLRVLRFFRFHARYGNGPPDAAAISAIRQGVDGLARLSAERVWNELKRILSGPQTSGTIALMRKCGVLTVLLPEATALDQLAALEAADAPNDPVLRLAALITNDGACVASRLRMSGDEARRLVALRTATAPTEAATDDDLRRALADTPKETLLGAAWLAGRSRALHGRILRMEEPVFPLKGRDLAAAGVAPGPAIGSMLRTMRAWWLEGGCRADAAACRSELARRLAESAGG